MKPFLMYYLTLIILFVGNCFIGGVIGKNVEVFKDNVVLFAIVNIISLIITSILYSLLNYGTSASITALKRGEKITFGTFFRKIKERIGKIFAIYGIVFLKIILYLTLIIPIGLLFIMQSINKILLLIGIIGEIVLIVILLYKLLTLFIAHIFSNYILYDNPEKSAKEILKKATEVVKNKACSYITLILTSFTIIGAFTLLILLSMNFDWLIWKPEIQVGFFYAELVNTMPTWWIILKTSIIIISTVTILIKNVISTSAFYETLEGDNLFEHKVEKEPNKYGIIAIILMVIYVVSVVGLFFLSQIETNKIINQLEDDIKNQEASYDKDEIKNNIDIEYVGISETGKVIAKIKNNNNQNVVLSSVYLNIYDESGEVEKIGSSNVSYFSEEYIKSNGENYVYFSTYKGKTYLREKIEKLKYDFSITVEDISYFHGPKDYNFKIVSVVKDKKIISEIDKKVNNAEAMIIYYKNNKIIDVNTSDSETINLNDKTYIVFSDIPKVEDYDEFKIFVTKADDMPRKKSNKLKLKLQFEANTEDGKTIFKIKNNDKRNLSLYRVDILMKDSKGKIQDIISIRSNICIPKGKETYLDCKKIENIENFKLETCFFENYESEITNYIIKDINAEVDDYNYIKVTNLSPSIIEKFKYKILYYRKGKIVTTYEVNKGIWDDALIKPGETKKFEITNPNIEYDKIVPVLIWAE